MGKQLSLGLNLHYPVVITKLLRTPGDAVRKQEPLLEYSYEYEVEVGKEDDTWKEKQVNYVKWDSPLDGIISSWEITEGMTIEKDVVFVEVEEDCPHSVQFAGLCAMCGKDMTETSWASTSKDSERAKINMIHDHNFLKVSQGEASKAEEELQRRLLKNRKLSLVVDLDQTVIHACIEPTVGEWQRDPTSPNYDAVKDVESFQLSDEGPRTVAFGCWYYIKMRPGLKDFLSKVSELYELHVYTMGTRAYAINIAKIIDPDKKLFGDRIISRDENGSMTAKSLARLFPVDTKMVVIIDDRADVWPNNRPNLIKVHPYDFFLGIGDINSSFLPKREEVPKAAPKKLLAPKPESQPDEVDISDVAPETESKTPKAESPAVEAPEETKPEDGSSKLSALEELVKMGGGDDQILLQEQTAEQEKFLEKQIADRPLLHMQEELEKESAQDGDDANEMSNGDSKADHPHNRHNLLKDDDVELKYLEMHLSQVHKSFYEQYEGALVNARGGRVAQLKPGHNRKIAIKDETADLKIVPDVGQVMPALKSKVLKGTTLAMSGLVPLSVDLMRSEIAMQARDFGADLHVKLSKKVTHLITPSAKTRTHKVRQAAAKYPKIKIVTHQWLLDSISKWEKQDETPYLVEIHNGDRRRSSTNIPSPLYDDDTDDTDNIASEVEDIESIPPSQDDEQEDSEGVMPSADSGGLDSPIENMEGFDWKGLDDEMKEFLGSDDDSASDSDASTSSKSSVKSSKGKKRNHGEGTEDEDEDDSDEGSMTTKKARHANSRSTGLKYEAESSLPTPNDDANDEDDDWGDLEADLEAELAKDEAEE